MTRPDYLTSGDPAQLIPVETRPELRNTSATCAVLVAVDEFADTLLGALGAPTGQRARTHVWLEPVFKSVDGEDRDRPDALIVVANARRQWRALVEAKARNAELDASQIERYLDMAKAHDIDAVVTPSNQFVATPTQSPCDVNRQKLRKVALFHWSWSYLKTEAKIELAKRAVSDPDQAYILNEYVRFLEHDAAGVAEFEEMGKPWVDTCKLYFAKSRLERNSPAAAAAVSDWDELMRSTALRMSRVLETNVTTILRSKDRKDPNGRLEELQASFATTGVLTTRLAVPGAAAPITVEADLPRRSLTVSMAVDAPKDRKRASATVTWLLRQLAKCEDGSVMLVAQWPGRTPETCAELARIRENVDVLVGNRKGQLPHTFILRAVSDLGGKFTQRRNFVPEVVACVMRFYAAVGQYVVPWQPPPPKPKEQSSAGDPAQVASRAGAEPEHACADMPNSPNVPSAEPRASSTASPTGAGVTPHRLTMT